MQAQPFILTLKLDEVSQAFFNAARKKYFPPERNYLDAHLMLFHQLPAESATYDFFKAFHHQTFAMQVTGLMRLGAGVAYGVESEALRSLHQLCSRHFHRGLIAQDRQGFRPHMTIMNKTTPEQARILMAQLQEDFHPFTITAIGLDLWTYLNGPWQHQQTRLFSNPEFQPIS